MNDRHPILRRLSEPVQNKGTVSLQPVARVLWRRRFDGDARGSVFLTLCEHEPKPGYDRRRQFLHIHAEHEKSGSKRFAPAAFNVPQLAGLVRALQAALDEMSPQGPRALREPAGDPGAGPRRVRGRRANRHPDDAHEPQEPPDAV